jgi:hypothetical protein
MELTILQRNEEEPIVFEYERDLVLLLCDRQEPLFYYTVELRHQAYLGQGHFISVLRLCPAETRLSASPVEALIDERRETSVASLRRVLFDALPRGPLHEGPDDLIHALAPVLLLERFQDAVGITMDLHALDDEHRLA